MSKGNYYGQNEQYEYQLRYSRLADGAWAIDGVHVL
jgi:hypothetical protein